jgi:hypothetical protein
VQALSVLVDAEASTASGGSKTTDPCVRMAPEKRKYLFGVLQRDPSASNQPEAESDDE